MTAQAPVFPPLSTWYTWSSPSRLLHRLSFSAISSSPTAPVNKTDLGGRTYYNPKKSMQDSINHKFPLFTAAPRAAF